MAPCKNKYNTFYGFRREKTDFENAMVGGQAGDSRLSSCTAAAACTSEFHKGVEAHTRIHLPERAIPQNGAIADEPWLTGAEGVKY